MKTPMTVFISRQGKAFLVYQEHSEKNPFGSEKPKAVVPIPLDDCTAEMFELLMQLEGRMESSFLDCIAKAAFEAGRMYGRNERP